MTYYTQPDLLPVPDDGSQPALALPTLRALADAVQGAFSGLRARVDGLENWQTVDFASWGNGVVARLGLLEGQMAARRVAVGGQALVDGANNPVTIETGLSVVHGASAVNGNPAVEQGTVTAVTPEGGRIIVYHTFTGGQRQINWMAVGA
jgi:hypothetical protein